MINSLRVHTNSPWLTMLITAVAYLIFIVVRLDMHNGDASVFVVAGDRFVDARQSPAGLAIRPDSDGYDGQFYYRLALDPFTTRATDFGITLDNPPWRQQRIVYPVLTRALALGRIDLIPLALIAVNYLALCAIGWLGGSIVQALQRHALWGLALALYPGFLFTLARDTAEIVQVCFVLASLWCLLHNRPHWATLLLIIAVLTKETALLVAFGAFGAYVIHRRRPMGSISIKWYYFVIPALVFAGWQLLMLNRWQQLPILAGGVNLDWPLANLLAFARRALGLEAAFRRRTLIELGFIIVMIVAPALELRRSQASMHIKLTWLLSGLLLTLLTAMIWIENIAYLRALSDFYVFGMLIVLGAAAAIRWPVVASAIVMWLFSFSYTTRLE